MNLKLTRPQAHALFVVLLCLLLSCAGAFGITFARSGFNHFPVSAWLRDWGVSFVAMLPVAWFGVPLLRRVVDGVSR